MVAAAIRWAVAGDAHLLHLSLGLTADRTVLLAEGGQPHNFIVMRPRKNTLVLTIRLKQSADIESRLEESGIGAPEFDKRESGYRIRLGADDVTARQKILRELIEMAYREHEG